MSNKPEQTKFTLAARALIVNKGTDLRFRCVLASAIIPIDKHQNHYQRRSGKLDVTGMCWLGWAKHA